MQYNDHELLYLIYEGNDQAYDILMNKYQGLIKKRIRDFKVRERSKDDFFQEGLAALDKAILTYDEFLCKSFTNYFDLCLCRRIMTLMNREKNYFYKVILYPDSVSLPQLCDSTKIEYAGKLDDIAKLNKFSELEKNVYGLLEQGASLSLVAKELDIGIKGVYNSLYRIRNKTEIKEKLKK